MQIYALDLSGSLVSAIHAQKKASYLCPECASPLRLRGGDLRRLHFYHIDLAPSCRLNGKSETHLAIQFHLQNLFGAHDCHLEQRFASIGRIGDCYCPSKKIVYEIQCSPIAVTEVKERMKDYASIGLKVFWILHDKQFNRNFVTAAEAYLLSYTFVYTNFDNIGTGTFYQQHFTVKDGRRHLYKKEIVDLLTFPPKQTSLLAKIRKWLQRRWV